MSQLSMPLQSQTYVIVGGAGSIGSAVANKAAERGATVVIIDNDRESIQRVVTQMPTGSDHYGMKVDICSSLEVDAAITEICSRGSIDSLILAAGVYPSAVVSETSDDLWETTIATNLDAVFYFLRAADRHLSDHASLVLLASVAAHRGSPGHSAYAASKAGLIGLVRSMAGEVRKRYRINAVSPGIIENQMTKDLRAEGGEDLLKTIPVGRYGRAEEVAEAILFLASARASYIHGEVLHVNGGQFSAG